MKYQENNSQRNCVQLTKDTEIPKDYLSDYLSPVDTCNLIIVAILYTCIQNEKEVRSNVSTFQWVKRKLSVGFEKGNCWQKKLICFILSIMNCIGFHKKAFIVVLCMLALLLLLSTSLFILGLFAFVSLIIYVPVMQIIAELNNYCVLKISHKRFIGQNEFGKINETEMITVMDEEKRDILTNVISNNYEVANKEEFSSYELYYIDNVVKNLTLSNKMTRKKIFLVKRNKENSYKILLHN